MPMNLACNAPLLLLLLLLVFRRITKGIAATLLCATLQTLQLFKPCKLCNCAIVHFMKHPTDKEPSNLRNLSAKSMNMQNQPPRLPAQQHKPNLGLLHTLDATPDDKCSRRHAISTQLYPNF
jgi:hypothetical protein